jgi:hypothetical protein
MNACDRFCRWLIRVVWCLPVPTSPPLTPKPTITIPPDDRISYARKLVERQTRSHTRLVYEDPLWNPSKIQLDPPNSTPQNFHLAMYV